MIRYADDSLVEYLDAPAVNSSILREIVRASEAHARYRLDHPLKSSAFALGSAIHCVLLEPERLKRDFSVRPEGIDGRTKQGRQVLAEWREQAAGKTLVPDVSAWSMMQGAVESCYQNDLAAALLTSPEGWSERSAYWVDSKTGLPCKARPDRITPHPETGKLVRVDVKTMPSIDPFHVQAAVRRFRYDMQAAHWPADADAQPFYIIAVEKQPPFATAVFELDPLWQSVGRQDRDDAMRRWNAAIDSDHYPGIPNGLLEVPNYLMPDLENI